MQNSSKQPGSQQKIKPIIRFSDLDEISLRTMERLKPEAIREEVRKTLRMFQRVGAFRSHSS